MNRHSGASPMPTARAGNGTPLTACIPTGVVRSGVVVLHEIWGVTPSIGDVTARLCAAGYAAAAPHLYHRQPEPTVAGDVRRARQLLHALRATEIEQDIISTSDYLTRAGAARIGTLGFSMGATIAFWTAARMPVAAAVSFYGGGIRRARWPGIAPAIDLAATVSAPWIGFYGDKDTGIPVEEVERLRTALELAAAPTEIIRYPHAAHAFALDAAEHRYAPVEAQDAWRRTSAFLAAHLHS
jgi:carboxymethylenebutenolidase